MAACLQSPTSNDVLAGEHHPPVLPCPHALLYLAHHCKIPTKGSSIESESTSFSFVHSWSVFRFNSLVLPFGHLLSSWGFSSSSYLIRHDLTQHIARRWWTAEVARRSVKGSVFFPAERIFVPFSLPLGWSCQVSRR